MEKDTKKEIKFSVQMTPAVMFDFSYWHSYHGIYGIINYGLSLIGLIALLAGFGQGNLAITLLLVALALLFPVINPLLLYYKSAVQVKMSPMFQKPLQYRFDENGIAVSQDNQTDSAAWDAVLLIRETKKNLILYMGAANAMILPKKDMEGQEADVKNLLRSVAPELAKKLK